MSATITVTGKAGAGVTVTASVFPNINCFTIDATSKNMLTMIDSSGRTTMVTIDSATTITATKSGSTYTLTIS